MPAQRKLSTAKRRKHAASRAHGSLAAIIEAADPHSPPTEDEILSLILLLGGTAEDRDRKSRLLDRRKR